MAVSPLSLIRGVQYTAVDFGHSSIKYLSTRIKNDKIKLLASGRKELPEGTIKNGKVVDTHLLTKTIADIFKEKNIKNGILLLTPASGHELIKTIKMPKMPDDDLNEALIWEVQDFLDLPPEKIALDYIILNEDDTEYELLVTVLSKDILNNHLKVFKNNMLDVNVVNLEAMALISLISKNKSRDKTSLILDVGENSSKLMIVDENNLYLNRGIETSGSDFTKLFLTDQNTYEEAEIEKKKFEFFADQAEKESESLELILSDINNTNTIQKQVKSLADEIIHEINRSLEYHNERNSDSPISNIYLTGGGLLLNGLYDYIESQIEIEMSIIDPLEEFETKNNSNQTNNNFMAVAAGTIISEAIHNES